MSTNLVRNGIADRIEQVVIGGDLAKLTPEERVSYYQQICQSVGLNPLTRPFDYITLNGKLTLYARKDATDQLRAINQISVTIQAREVTEECYVVTARAATPAGRTDESIGAVSIANLKGEARCNAMMKAETKAKRRVTLSISGLGLLDESELESIPDSRKRAPADTTLTTEDIPLDMGNRKAQGAASGPVARIVSDAIAAEIPKTQKTVEQIVEEAQETGVSPKIDYCQKPENTSFFANIRKALPRELQVHTETIGRDWLKHKGYKKASGEGSLQSVEKALFPELMKECMEYIDRVKASIVVNEHGVAASNEDLPSNV